MIRDRVRPFRPLLSIALLVGLASLPLVALAACNTVAGAGEDLKAVSRNTQEAIRNATDGDRRD